MDATFAAGLFVGVIVGSLGGYIAGVVIRRANERRTDRPVREIDRRLDAYEYERRKRTAEQNIRTELRRILDEEGVA